MAAKTRFTDAEDAIIIEEVQNCPNNLTNAFWEAAKRIRGKSEKAIGNRYVALAKKVKMFMVMTPHGALINVKNTGRKKVKKSMKLELIEFAMEKLSKDEKQYLLKRLNDQ